MNETYSKQVSLLIRVMPSVYKIRDFAVHGGTAINLFHRNLSRYSVDIDLTYIPIADRESSLQAINQHLAILKASIEKTVPGIRIIHKKEVLKLLCCVNGTTVKIEVNGTKRGLIGDMQTLPLCDKAKKEFGMTCFANIVSWSQLYGGKIVAALSRQHPRDLFDCRGITGEEFAEVKSGFMLCLLGSDKPIIESLAPNPIDQNDALENQFVGMTDEPFSYGDYETSRKNLIEVVNAGLSELDREFLISFENGEPAWDKCCGGNLSHYPSVKWKLQNIEVLKKKNPSKHKDGVGKLIEHFQRDK